jgi:cell division septum initiation protein DivIVA
VLAFTKGGMRMGYDKDALLVEVRDLLKIVADEQQKLLNDIRELKDEHRKLREEVRLNNFVLNNITARSEIIN